MKNVAESRKGAQGACMGQIKCNRMSRAKNGERRGGMMLHGRNLNSRAKGMPSP
jgi:hypothetical protein